MRRDTSRAELPAGTTRCVRTPRALRRTDNTSRAATVTRRTAGGVDENRPARIDQSAIEISWRACRHERRADDVGVEPQLLDGAHAEAVR